MAKAKKPIDLPEGELIREKPPSRKPGRPKRKQPVLTPEKIDQIEAWYLQAVGITEIASRLGVAKNAISYHLDTDIRPRWRQYAAERFEEQLAKVNFLERVAWERFNASQKPETSEELRHALSEPDAKGKKPDPKLVAKVVKTIHRTGEKCWLDVIQWCHDYIAKVGGYYQSDPLGDTKTELRPVIVPILVSTRQQAQAAMTFEDLTKAAREQNVPGAEILDVPSYPTADSSADPD